MIPSPKPQSKSTKQGCDVPGCRGPALGKPMCRTCGALITPKERKRFMAAIGATNKLRYYEKILVPAIARRHQHRGRN